MKHPVSNRIEAEMMQWQAKEQRLAGLFSASVLASRDFQKEKLAHFERILGRNVAGLSSEERTTLRMLRRETKNLERKLYPNLVLRLLRTAIKKLFQPAIDGKRELRMASQERDIHETIKKMGLDVPKVQIGKKLRMGVAPLIFLFRSIPWAISASISTYSLLSIVKTVISYLKCGRSAYMKVKPSNSLSTCSITQS